MTSVRRHLPRLAALVLLLWLFAAGAAFAKVCVTHVHLEHADGCCVSMQAATVHTDSMAEAIPPAQPAQPWLAVAAAAPLRFDAAPAMAQARLRIRPAWNDSGQRIHLVLQRLAL